LCDERDRLPLMRGSREALRLVETDGDAPPRRPILHAKAHVIGAKATDANVSSAGVITGHFRGRISAASGPQLGKQASKRSDGCGLKQPSLKEC
jgi:hypothetical protein